MELTGQTVQRKETNNMDENNLTGPNNPNTGTPGSGSGNPTTEPAGTGSEGANGAAGDDLAGVFVTHTAEDILARPEMAKALQSLTDSRITKALNTARTKWQQEMDDNLDEAQKLSKMTQEQRDKYQFNKDKAKFEAEKKKFEHEQLILATGTELNKRGLNAQFAPYLTAEDAETTKGNIDAFEKMFNDAVSEALNGRMKGQPPKDITSGVTLTNKDIEKMSTSEINARWEEVQKVLAANK